MYSNVDCTGSRYGGCTYFEHVVFEVPEEEMRRVLTATPEDRRTKVWQFRVKNQGTRDYDDGIPLNEILAVLQTVDEYEPVATR